MPALGTKGVDFEGMVDNRRLHRYRLSRVKCPLENSDLGALLVFDVNKIRSIVSSPANEPQEVAAPEPTATNNNGGIVAGLVPARTNVYGRSKTIELAPTS